MKASSLRENTDEELRQMCEDTRKALSEIKVQSIVGEAADNPMMIRQHRRNIARIQTVMSERASQKKGNE